MRSAYLLAVLGLLAACTPDHPFDKPGTWSLGTHSSVNDTNLRSMVADPQDLTWGAGARGSLGAEAGPPVGRLLSGHRFPLPQSDLTQLQGVGVEQPQMPQGSNQ
jgi:hypothetical protein